MQEAVDKKQLIRKVDKKVDKKTAGPQSGSWTASYDESVPKAAVKQQSHLRGCAISLVTNLTTHLS